MGEIPEENVEEWTLELKRKREEAESLENRWRSDLEMLKAKMDLLRRFVDKRKELDDRPKLLEKQLAEEKDNMDRSSRQKKEGLEVQ